MKEELLNKIRIKLREKQKIRDENIKKCHALEASEEVIQYMKLRGIKPSTLEEFYFDEKKLIMSEYFNALLNESSDTNHIYRCNGQPLQEHNRNDINKIDISYSYTDIENGRTILIKEDDAYEFEKNHIVLHTSKNIYPLQQEFVMDAVTTSQDDAIERIKCKYKKV